VSPELQEKQVTIRKNKIGLIKISRLFTPLFMFFIALCADAAPKSNLVND
jgi:hypothetical protein